MADQTFDPRLESLLRGALAKEAASLPFTVAPDDVLGRAASRTSRRRLGWRALPGKLSIPRLVPALGSAAVVVVVAVLALNFYANRQGIGGPATPAPTLSPSPGPTAGSGGMWPQSSLDEVQHAQERADAGDPAYRWQIDWRLASEEWWGHVKNSGSELVERFLQEELGWDQFLFNPYQPDEYPADQAIRRVAYLRCGPTETNPLYPVAPSGPQEAHGAELCAPTLDDFRYETVSVDLAQPGEQGRTGIWVVSRWTMTAPFMQKDPLVAEADATALLEDFLAARIEGHGAEGIIEVSGYSELTEIPLLYATTAGAHYERYEIDVVSRPQWPYGEMEFTVRLFAAGGATVVEQPISLSQRPGGLTLWFKDTETTENGQPLDVPYVFLEGEVGLHAAYPWVKQDAIADMGLALDGEDGELVIMLADPLPVATGCETGAPPADADALARSLQSDPDFESTDPVAVTLGGIEGLSMDLTNVPGASVCLDIPGPKVLTPDFVEHRGGLTLERGARIRLYLLDAPEGSSMRILAIAVVAPEARLKSVAEAAATLLDSIEFQAP